MLNPGFAKLDQETFTRHIRGLFCTDLFVGTARACCASVPHALEMSVPDALVVPAHALTDFFIVTPQRIQRCVVFCTLFGQIAVACAPQVDQSVADVSELKSTLMHVDLSWHFTVFFVW